MKAKKLIGFCSSQGISDKNGNILCDLFPNDAEKRIQELESEYDYYSGTVRFLRGAATACRRTVRCRHLLSYQENGVLIQELFSREGIGTQIVIESAEQIRRVHINDIWGYFRTY